MERRGFLKGAAALFGLGGVVKAAEPKAAQIVQKREIRIGEIPVWIDEETLLRESGDSKDIEGFKESIKRSEKS